MQRRRFLTGVTATTGALLAGCAGGASESGDGNGSDRTTGSTTGTTTGGSTTDANSGGNGAYSVSMAPMGEVTFESVPQTWVANNGSWADMGAALGVEPPKALWLPERYHTQYYDGIPGISVDTSKMTTLFGDGGSVSKETYYQLDGDVHVQDPTFLLNRAKNWKRADIDEITTNVAPFVGNTGFSRGYSWHENYRYYSLYDAFGKLAKVFKREQRYNAFSKLHDGFQSQLSNIVPSKSERPAVAILWAGGNQPEKFSPYLIGKGTSFKQWRDLEVRDALAETDVENFHASRAEIDYETLLEIDPEMLLLRGHEDQTATKFQGTVVQFLRDHDIASDLTAVKNGDVYRGGPLYQGPITNLVLTERAAKQVYGVSKELFDRKRVADIVAGKFSQ
ncbi:ABC transporter substrate-binding protein [Halococcus qingdaonensis]|uniref:ABC transporter substrate-binding protein n=1 Tax=Halococcus qingdaonensis TaxID=224402 RepID=UPI002116D566|nr:ABC transporter substrate-binding protein [Halococcus qingdaonensis]